MTATTMTREILRAVLLAATLAAGSACASVPVLKVRPTEDFAVTGKGDHAAWEKAGWVGLRRRQPDGHPYETRVKVLYSRTGVYLLMDGADRKITTTGKADFQSLWTEDVFEAFFWTDERFPVYFEYEISPTGSELPLIVPNLAGDFHGWLPYAYEKERRARKATAVEGGARTPGAAISGWRAEVFIPYALLAPLRNVPPAPGTRWRANFYRIDHDDGRETQWDWAPVGPTFHDPERFGVLVFE
jgi:hypothetical protein